jgi:flavin-dependent dehydrogenase
MPVRDVIIVGAGPSGLAAAITAKQHNLDYVVLEQGVLVELDFPVSAADGVLYDARAA